MRIRENGTSWNNITTLKVNSSALEVSHQNKSFCYISHETAGSAITCANVDNFTQQWRLGKPKLFEEVKYIQQMAIDWITGNFYFLDDMNEIITICNSLLDKCNILVETDLKKPRAFTIDPTKGYLYFTKWGQSAPMVERCDMDGSNRIPLVTQKIVFPYGITVDYPSNHIYWVDTYLDFVERINSDGSNRRTILKGKIVQNLYGISVFENKIYVSSWHNNSIMTIDKKTKNVDKIVYTEIRPFNLKIFHQQRQPNSKYKSTVLFNNTLQHTYVTLLYLFKPVIFSSPKVFLEMSKQIEATRSKIWLPRV